MLRCSFCGKAQHEVRRLIAGPEVFICDECVALCTQVLADLDGVAGGRPDPRHPRAAAREGKIDAVEALIARSRQRGCVTYDELNAVLVQDLFSSEQIEEVLATLSDAGIDVVETDPEG